MEQYKVINACDALAKLGAMSLPAKVSYKLWTLTRKLEPTYMFVEAEKKKLLNEWHGTVDGRGRVMFATKGDEKGFINAINDLASLDVEVDYAPVEVPMSCLEGIDLSMEDFEKLNGFVSFVEDT